MTKFLMYALGGGRGHAVRGASVAQALCERGAAVTILVPTHNLAIAQTLAPLATCQAIARCCDASSLAKAVGAAMAGVDAMVVDTFPEGLLDELSLVGPEVPRYALLRCRRDATSRRFMEGLAACRGAVDLESSLPWLGLRSDVEAMKPVARKIVGSDAPRERSAWLIPGQDARLSAFMGRLAERLRDRGVGVRLLAPGEGLFAMQAPPHVVVGAAGYNLTYELARAGIHHLGVPRPRPFDDQRGRATKVAETLHDPQALEERVHELVREPIARSGVAVVGHATVADWLIEASQRAYQSSRAS